MSNIEQRISNVEVHIRGYKLFEKTNPIWQMANPTYTLYTERLMVICPGFRGEKQSQCLAFVREIEAPG